MTVFRFEYAGSGISGKSEVTASCEVQAREVIMSELWDMGYALSPAAIVLVEAETGTPCLPH